MMYACPSGGFGAIDSTVMRSVKKSDECEWLHRGIIPDLRRHTVAATSRTAATIAKPTPLRLLPVACALPSTASEYVRLP